MEMGTKVAKRYEKSAPFPFLTVSCRGGRFRFEDCELAEQSGNGGAG